jgi:hypothetical protein
MGGTLPVPHMLINGEPSGRLVAGRFGRGVERMNAYESTSLLGLLMATSLASGAGALEFNQSRTPSTSETPAFTMPSFLDGTRLPDLQDAWRARFGEASEAAAREPQGDVGAPALGAGDTALETARKAMTRAEQAGREAAAVRTRAEELSRRFGAGESGAASPEANSAETASISTDASAADAAQPAVEQVLAPADDNSAATDTAPELPTPKAADAPVIEDMATKPAKSAKRAPSTASHESMPTTAHKQAPTKASPTLAASNDAVQAKGPDANALMPTEIRAFGWNAQP